MNIWSELNALRVALIKQVRLTEEEREELKSLQAEMSKEINAADPLPFEALDWLENQVKGAESRNET